MNSLHEKIDNFNGVNVWKDLHVDSPPIENNEIWTNEIDRVILCSLSVYGYGDWIGIRSLLRLCPTTSFSFSAFNIPDDVLKKRADDLLEIVHEEFPQKHKKNRRY
jgi:hypothetical protein